MVSRDLTILGRQRDGDGQNKLLQINGSKDSYYQSYEFNTVLEVEDMGLKLHLLWLGMQPLYQDVKICDLAS